MRGFLSYLLDSLMPRSCLGCGRELVPFDLMAEAAAAGRGKNRLREFFGAGLVYDLLPGIPGGAEVLCPACWSALEPAGGPGAISRPGAAAVPVVSPFFTDDGLLALVRFLKFSGGRSAAPALGWWMADALREYIRLALREPPVPGAVRAPGPGAGARPVLVPVPLHRARERSRGYNQAALLAWEAAERLGLEVEGRALRRNKNTRSQSTLEEGDRAANVAGAFGLVRGDLVAGRPVFLVDDLVTTGATALACAAALAEAGPASIAVLCAGRVRG